MVNWKAIAITFIVLFTLLLAFNVWSVSLYYEEETALNDCYYNTCAEYPQAYYSEGVCTCYDYDNLGELFVTKTSYK